MIDATIWPIDINSNENTRGNLKLRLLCLLGMQLKLKGQYFES